MDLFDEVVVLDIHNCQISIEWLHLQITENASSVSLKVSHSLTTTKANGCLIHEFAPFKNHCLFPMDQLAEKKNLFVIPCSFFTWIKSGQCK